MSESNSGPEEQLRRPSTRQELEQRAKGTLGGEISIENIQKVRQQHKVEIPPNAIVNMADARIEIPVGLDLDDLRRWVEERIEDAEATNEFFDPDTIGAFRRAINNYRLLTIIPRADVIEAKKQLVTLAEARGYLSSALLNLSLRRYEEFANSIPQLNSERILALIENIPGLRESIHELEMGNGAYFRLIPTIDPDPTHPTLPSREVVRQQIAHRLVGTIPGVGNEKDAVLAVQTAEKLFQIFGMASYYAGPVDRAGNLVDQLIINQLYATHHGGTLRGQELYFENREYWEYWRDWRLRNMDRKKRFVPSPADPTRSLPDPAMNMRRLMYFPEELDDGSFGNTESLRYSAESYVRSAPHFFGQRTMEEFIDFALGRIDERIQPFRLVTVGGFTHFELEPINSADPNSRLKGNIDSIFRWGNLVKGAGETSTTLLTLLNEPLIGGEAMGNPSNIGSTVENLKNTIEKYGSYLYPGYRKLFSLASSRIIESIINYANGNSPDRKRHFPNWPKVGTWLRNTIVEMFNRTMTPEDLELTKVRLKASTGQVITKSLGKETLGWVGDIVKAFGSALTRK